MNTLYNEMKSELKNILTFWSDNDIDNENGGFYGCIKNDLSIEKNHIKSGVLTTRILWTFSRAYSILKDNKYLTLAKRAYDYLVDYFLDKEYGGIYTALNYDGSINNSEKQVYYQAFTIYALSEYYVASSDENALNLALKLFDMLETICKDSQKGGYFNAYSREWNNLDDTSLSEKDMNCDKIMNTCLHILEAYTNLYRVSHSEKVKKSLKDILLINLDKIMDSNSYKFNLYFDKDWTPLSAVNSFGHDIEGSWLICEAAELLDDKELKDRVFSTAVKMADEVIKHGISDSGEIYAEAENGVIISDSTEWWMFAEAVVGLYNAYQITGIKSYLDYSEKVWEFTKAHLIDRNAGEWFWGIKNKSYEPFGDDLVSEWKCPYHNSRMCIEIMNRIESDLKICENDLIADFSINSKSQLCLNYIGLKQGYDEKSVKTDDYRPAFQIGATPGYGHLGKKCSNEGINYSYKHHKKYTNEFGKKLEIVLSNEFLEVTLHYQFFTGANAVRSYSTVRNISKDNQLLLYITSFHLSNIEYPRQIMIVNNGWCSESDAHFFSPADLGLVQKSHGVPSKRVFVSNIGTQSTKEYQPIGYIDNMMWQIESNVSWEWEIADCGKLYLSLSGPSDESEWAKILQPGEEFESVKSAITYGENFDKVVGEMTKYRRIIKGKNNAFLKQPVIFNDFNNCLMSEPTYEKEIPCIEGAAKIGAEYYCVDGGWFTDGYWWDGVGEWIESEERFHGKLKEVFEYIAKKGMKPGIWLEPEVMGIKCAVADNFPDDCFFMRYGKRVIHRDRYQLDFRNKNVTDYLTGVIDRLIKDYKIEFFKFDYNIDAGIGTEVNSCSFGDGLLENGRAFLEWVKSVMTKYPDIIFESCASGAMRMDYSTLSVFHLQSTSDQENYIDTSLVSANSPIALLPEQAGVWSYPLGVQDADAVIFNMLNSMRNCMYISGEIMKLDEKSIDIVRDAVSLYKQIRDDIKISVPFFPLGVSSYQNPVRAVGYDCGSTKYIIVWNCSDESREIKINTCCPEIKYVYPSKVHTEINNSVLTVSLNGKSACMVVL